MEGYQVDRAEAAHKAVIDYFAAKAILANQLAQAEEQTVTGPAKLICMPVYMHFHTIYLHAGQVWHGKGIVWSKKPDTQKES